MSAMTVEHSQVDYVHNQRQTLFDQLKEITGVGDEAVLEQALQASRVEGGKYDLTRAVNVLVDENALKNTEIRRKFNNNNPTVKRDHIVARQKDGGNVIDLTNDGGSEKEALEKAIALSLQEQHGMLGGQVSTEEQDISKVLEQSLLESKAGTKRKREEIWQDPLNPYERKRNGEWPVGLKNVGNTCWFSSVMQSLFHLPVFQQLVLRFTSPDETNEAISHSAGRRNLLFMQELRRLFALMVGSERKYVDPSKAIHILKEAFPCGSSDSQQDVSEFTHKLIEWLEDAFRSEESEKSMEAGNDEEKCGKTSSNPMVDLFYGRFRSEGQNEGHIFSNEETFGQYPLQVNGFSNIHESLEAATAQEIESGKPSQESISKSGQEHWFTKLPPVLIFELSRFQFNQHLGRPEKIHNKFDFPEVIYMDRYVEVNKNITKTKREEVRKMRESREELQGRLDKYTNYGSGAKRFPLQDVLQYALEFVESKPETFPCTSSDINMASPCSVSSMNTDSPCNSPVKTVVVDSSLHSKKIREQVGICEPVPKHVTDSELRVLQTCLTRWRTEVEHDIRSLQDGLNSMDEAINSIYNEPTLQKLPYRLHAVLVHEGQAASGHYWAYVYNHRNKIWMKFNDITVTEASWDELEKESVGGYHNASAYCLMYIDCNKRDLVEDDVDKESGLENLPNDMQELVNEDNSVFRKEMLDWNDEEAPAESESEDSSDEDVICTWDCAYLLDKTLVQLVENTLIKHCTNDPETDLAKVVETEKLRIEKAVKDTIENKEDYRLDHVLMYILVVQPTFPDICIRVNLLQHFANMRVGDNSYFKKLKKLAFRHVKNIKSSPSFQPHRTLYKESLEDYTKFRFAAYKLSEEINSTDSSNYGISRSLHDLVDASIINEQLMKKYNNPLCCAHCKTVISMRRKFFLKANDAALQGFDSGNDEKWSECLKMMNDSVLPYMYLLNAPDAVVNDSTAAERIRASWCSKLGDEISVQRRVELEKLLRNLLDPPNLKKIPVIQNEFYLNNSLSKVFKLNKLE